MFDVIGILVEGFIYVWIAIIASIPGIFMSGLFMGIGATVLTYFGKPDSPQG